MSWIVAGIAAGSAILSASAGNKAEREAADLEKFENQIGVERFKADAALASFNMTRDLGIMESEQIAMSAAMGKQGGVGSVANIQAEGRKDLATNIGRIDDEVARAEKYGKVTDDAIGRASSANQKTRNVKAGTAGLLSFAKAFA